MADPRSESEAPAPAEAAQTQDAKDKFRAALERKQGRRHPHEAASQHDSKVHDAHSAAGGKRTFRRKSG